MRGKLGGVFVFKIVGVLHGSFRNVSDAALLVELYELIDVDAFQLLIILVFEEPPMLRE